MPDFSPLLPRTEGHSIELVVAAYVLLSVVAFVNYGMDKAAAKSGGQRVPEVRLHALALLGGWPGALVARHLYRHKTKKQPFRTVFWMTVFANCTAVVWMLSRVH